MTARRAGGRLTVALFGALALVATAACERLATNLGGGVGPEAGILRGKLPARSRGVLHLPRLTDGIAASPGDPWRTDLTAVLSSSDAFVTWDLGREMPVRCALFDADGDDSYALSVSSDGQTFVPLWTAGPDEDPGQQLRAGRDLGGAGRFLRLSAAGGDGHWSVSEVSAWSDCPKTWPPLAMQKGTPDEEAVRTKLWAFAALGLAYVLLYRKRAPDWMKLLGVAPAGVGVALAVQVAQIWPPPSSLVPRLACVVAALAVAFALRLLVGRKSPPAGPVALALIGVALACTACGRSDLDAPSEAAACDDTPVTGWQSMADAPYGAKIAADAQGNPFLAEPLGDPSGASRTRLLGLDDAGQSLWEQDLDGAPGALAAPRAGGLLAVSRVAGTAPVDPTVRAGGTPRSASIVHLDVAGHVGARTDFGDATGDLAPSFVTETTSGDVFVGGAFVPDAPPNGDFNPDFRFAFFVAHLSSAGTVVWERNVADQGSAQGFVVDGAGRFGVVVWVRTSGAAIDGLDLKTADGGTAIVWFDGAGKAVEAHDLTEVTLGSDVETDGESASDALFDDQGRLYVAGSISRDALGEAMTSQIFVSAFDGAGARLWSYGFRLGSETGAALLSPDPCGGIDVVGNAANPAMGFLVARVTRDGQLGFESTVDTSTGQQVVSAAATHGGVYVTGANAVDVNHQVGFVARLGF